MSKPQVFDINRVSIAEEKVLAHELRKDAFKMCDEWVKPYVECAKGRSVSIVWACRQEKKDMQACIEDKMGEPYAGKKRERYLARKKERYEANLKLDNQSAS